MPWLDTIWSQESPPLTTYVVVQSWPAVPRQSSWPGIKLLHDMSMPGFVAASW